MVAVALVSVGIEAIDWAKSDAVASIDDVSAMDLTVVAVPDVVVAEAVVVVPPTLSTVMTSPAAMSVARLTSKVVAQV